MEEYQINDLSDKKLKFGYWFLTHKQQLLKILASIISFVCLVVWIPAIYGLVIYIKELPQDKQIISSIANVNIDFESWIERNRPQELQISSPMVIYTGNKKYDFIANVYNPNPKRGVMKLEYRFVSGEFTTPISSVVVMPEETVYLLSLGIESQRGIQSPSLEIIKIHWQRLLGEKIKYQKTPVEIMDSVYTAASEGVRSMVKFYAVNKSIENFWDVDFQAVLYSGNKIIGANQIRLEEFLSGENREVELSWYERLPRVTKVDVIPIINLYNPDNIYEILGEAVER